MEQGNTRLHYPHNMVNTIINEDCLVAMRDIPDGSIDMICCDLPYGVLHRGNPHAQWDRMIPFEPLWEQYERIIKKNGAIILFGHGVFTAKCILSNERLFRYSLVWDKRRVTGFLNANRMPMRCHEDILVFYKRLPKYNPQYTYGEPNHSRGNGKHKDTNSCYGQYGHKYQGRTYEDVPRVASTVPSGMKLPRSIVSIKKEHERTVYHPTQKPVDLLRWLIRTYTDEGDIVLDNCCGSGSTGVAAIKEKRRFILMEQSPEYCEIARKRVMDELREPTLF